MAISRRTLLIRGAEVGLGVAAVGLVGTRLLNRDDDPTYHDGDAFPEPGNPKVAIVKATSYDTDLERTVRDGLLAVGADVAGKSVLLKPNLVEYDAGTVINTDPRLVRATVVVMRDLGASSVTVGEGPGHRRDTEYVVRASGLFEAIRDVDAPFTDLNTAGVVRQALDSFYTPLGEIWMPLPVADADVVVSMPKMKTHHWAGATLSMKNCFGCVPGRVYGWPKNVLHWKGIQRSILDIVGAVNPTAVIVDGIVGMEGDGPIMGTPVQSGHLVFGTDPVATDVVAARVMGVDPERIDYLDEAGRYLGQSHWDQIRHVGEDPEATGLSFGLIPEFEYLAYGSTATRRERDTTGG
jgi:uncharacterized protein (DUF362 family)